MPLRLRRMASIIFGPIQAFPRGLFGGVLALPNQVTGKLQPRAFFLHHATFDAGVEDAAFLVDAVVVDDVEFGFGKRRGNLVFTTLTLT